MKLENQHINFTRNHFAKIFLMRIRIKEFEQLIIESLISPWCSEPRHFWFTWKLNHDNSKSETLRGIILRYKIPDSPQL